MPGTMPLRGPQGQGSSRAGTSMRGGPMGRGDYGKSCTCILISYPMKFKRSLVGLLVK